MPATLAPPSPANYTIGAHELLLGAATVGYIVTASVTPTMSYLSRFSATEGKDVEDFLAPDTFQMSIRASLEEVCTDNLRLFFLAAESGIVGSRPVRRSAVTFKGVAVVGNSYTWTIPDAIIIPDGDLGYNDNDWTNFSLRIQVKPKRSVNDPWGTLTVTAP